MQCTHPEYSLVYYPLKRTEKSCLATDWFSKMLLSWQNPGPPLVWQLISKMALCWWVWHFNYKGKSEFKWQYLFGKCRLIFNFMTTISITNFTNRNISTIFWGSKVVKNPSLVDLVGFFSLFSSWCFACAIQTSFMEAPSGSRKKYSVPLFAIIKRTQGSRGQKWWTW